jgi:putative glutamine amidotransferase
MARRKPLIGVTEPINKGNLSWWCIRTAIALAGGRAIKLTAAYPGKHLSLDGLVIAGGTDINPSLYGAAPVTTKHYDDERDRLEQYWFHRMYTQHKPILGICRGAQMINVCLGGTLYESIRLICEEAKYPRNILSNIFARKPIAILPSSRLANLIKKPICFVNSLHNQSIKHLGKDLIVTAKEHNGIVQAVEVPNYTFLLGVQWHPEYMLNSYRQRQLFRAFVQVTKHRNGHNSFYS